MKNSLIREHQKSNYKQQILSPERIGLCVLILFSFAIWGAYFLLSDGWHINETPNRRAILEATHPEVIDQTVLGPRIPLPTHAFYHYSERLEEQTALLISLTLTALHENLAYKRNPKDLQTLINLARTKNLSAEQRLWLPAWDRTAEINANAGWIKTDRSLHYLYFRPSPFGLEVMTVSLIGDPQITVARIPEKQGSPMTAKAEFSPEGVSGAALYVSPTTEAKLLPPFSPTAAFERWGWRRETLKLSFSSPERKAEIQNWIAKQTVPSN